MVPQPRAAAAPGRGPQAGAGCPAQAGARADAAPATTRPRAGAAHACDVPTCTYKPDVSSETCCQALHLALELLLHIQAAHFMLLMSGPRHTQSNSMHRRPCMCDVFGVT